MTETAVSSSLSSFCSGTRGGKRLPTHPSQAAPPPERTPASGRCLCWAVASGGSLLEGHSPKLSGWEGEEAARPPGSPGSWAGYQPPARPLPRGARPAGPSPGYLFLVAAPSALLAAQQLRDGQWGCVCLLRVCSGGQAHVRCGDRCGLGGWQPLWLGGGWSWATSWVLGFSASERTAGAEQLGEGWGEQTNCTASPTVTPPARRPRAPIRNSIARGPAPLVRRGGRWRAVLTRGPGEKQPPEAQLPKTADSQVQNRLCRLGGEHALQR